MQEHYNFHSTSHAGDLGLSPTPSGAVRTGGATLGIVLGDVKLACSCSAMETYCMKPLPHSFHDDINTSGQCDSALRC